MRRLARVAVLLAAGCAPSTDPVRVHVTPEQSSVVVRTSLQLSASVDAVGSEAVTWSKVSGPGTVQPDGRYIAPNKLPSDTENLAIIRATSVVAPSKFAEARLTVVEPPISPVRGPTRGGTAVRITGSGFVAGSTRVWFGGAEATVDVLSDLALDAVTVSVTSAATVAVRVEVAGAEPIEYPLSWRYVPSHLRLASSMWSAPSCDGEGAAAALDLDTDGVEEILVTCDRILQIFRLDGYGGFLPPSFVDLSTSTPEIPVDKGLEIHGIDLEGDGDLDVMVRTVQEGGGIVPPDLQTELFESIDGDLVSLGVINNGYENPLPRFGDITQDGFADSVELDQTGKLRLRAAIAPGQFGATTIDVPGTGRAVGDVADVDEDGYLDVLLVTSTGVQLVFGSATGDLSGGLTERAFAENQWALQGWARIVDVNGDGVRDVVGLGRDPVSLQMAQSYTDSIDIGDLRGTGALDLIALEMDDSPLVVSTGGFQKIYVGEAPLSQAIPARLDPGSTDTLVMHAGDALRVLPTDSELERVGFACESDVGDPDTLAMLLVSGSTLVAVCTQGAVWTTASTDAENLDPPVFRGHLPIDAGVKDALLVDVHPADGCPDLLYSDVIEVFGTSTSALRYEDCVLDPLSIVEVRIDSNHVYQAFTTGDFDGDARLDIAIVRTGDLIGLFGTDTGAWDVVPLDSAPLVSAATAADLDTDGDPELVLLSDVTNSLSTLDLAPSTRQSVPLGELDLPCNPERVAAGDVSGDGRIDALVRCEGGNQATVLQNASGDLELEQIVTSDFEHGLLVADLDVNGLADGVMWSDENALLANLSTGGATDQEVLLFAIQFTPSSLGSRSVAISDLDGDGLPDVVLGATGSLSTMLWVFRNTSR